MTSLVVAALAAALVSNFRSFPIATATGLLLGVGQTIVNRYMTSQVSVLASVPGHHRPARL